MNIIQKILISVASVAVLGVSAYFALDKLNNFEPDRSLDTPEDMVSDYSDLLAKAEQIKVANVDCGDKSGLTKQTKLLEDELADLSSRKKDWLDNVPKLPDVEPELVEPKNRPGSEVPELTSDVPPLPEVKIEVLGSEIPELSSDVPSLPEINIKVVDDSGSVVEYIPELPELNTGRPGSEVPELSSNVPPLPEIDDLDIINPDDYVFQMQDYENKIKNLLQELKTMCPEEESKKIISDKCEDACGRYKKCASYTEDATPADLNDAYNTCMEECGTWPKEMVKCINALDIKTPNDCIGFLNCQLPQLYEERYK